MVGAGRAGGAEVFAFTESGTRSGGGSCWFWLFPPPPPPLVVELLLLEVLVGLAGASRGLFLSTELLCLLSLAEPLLCKGFWVVAFVRPCEATAAVVFGVV